jgi:O-antigen ligase
MKITKWLLFLTAVSLPAYIFRCRDFQFCDQISPIPLTFLEVMIVLTFASWVGWKYVDIKKGRESLSRLSQRLKSPILWPALLLVFASLISSFLAVDVRGGLGIFKAYFLEGFLLFVVAFDVLSKGKKFSFFLAGLLLAAEWLSFYSIYQKVFTKNPFAPNEFLRGRVSGVYTTANALGLFLVPIFLLVLAWAIYEFQDRRNQYRWLFLIIADIPILFAIYLSGSRGALLALLLVTLFVAVYFAFQIFNLGRFFNRVVLFSLIVGIGLQLIIFFNISAFVPRSFAANSAQLRFCLWEGTKHLLVDRPIQGSGLNNFKEVYPEYRTCGTESLQYPHNLLLNFWTETGLLGLVAFLWFCLALIYGLLKSSLSILKISVVGVIVAIFGHGLVDVPFFKNDLAAEFWLIAAFGLFLVRGQSAVEGEPQPSRR